MALVRYSKILLILSVVFFGLLGIFNFVNWDGGLRIVEGVTSMSGVPGGESDPRATDNRFVVVLGLLFIALSKLVGGGFCAIGAFRMWQQRHAPAEDFNQAKAFAMVGGSILLLMLFGGFLFVVGNYFRAWQSEIGPMVMAMAFQFGGAISLIMIYVNQPDR